MDTSDNVIGGGNSSSIFNSTQSVISPGINPARVTLSGLMTIAITMLIFTIFAFFIGEVGQVLALVGSILGMIELIVFSTAAISSKQCTNYVYAAIHIITSLILFYAVIPAMLTVTMKCEGMSCMGVGMILIGDWIVGAIVSIIMFIVSLTVIRAHRTRPFIGNQPMMVQVGGVASEESQQPEQQPERQQQVASDNGISVLRKDDAKIEIGYSGVTVMSVILVILSILLASAMPLRPNIRLWSSTVTFICCIPVTVLLGALLITECLVKSIQKRTNIAVILCYIPALLSIIYNIFGLDHVSPIREIVVFGYIYWGVPLLSIIIALTILIIYIATLGKTNESKLSKSSSISLTAIAIVLYLVLAFLP